MSIVSSTKGPGGRGNDSRAQTSWSNNMGKLDPTQNHEDENNLQNSKAVRNISGFLDKYDRIEQQELLSQMTCHWLLSVEDFKVPIELPSGMISQLTQLHDDHMLVLIPYDTTIPPPDYREIHQIVRELTVGMYVCNQHPYLHFETNHDHSTSCQLPPAYIDSKLGQIMINTDYWLKALWHGSFFDRARRIQFVQKYLGTLDVDFNGNAQTKKSILKEFLNAGLSDIARDPEYAKIFKQEKNDENASYPGVGMTAEFPKSTITMIHEAFSEQTNKTDGEIEDEIRHFVSFIEDVSMQLTFGMSSVKRYKNMFEYTGEFDISSCCRADHAHIDDEKFERIKPILASHEKYLRQNLTRKTEVRRNVTFLKFASFLTPLLIALKKKMKIPDVNNLLPMMAGEEVFTERSLAPLMIGPGFKSKTFLHTIFEANRNNMSARTVESGDSMEYSNIIANETNRNPYFSLHGGIQFELETCSVTNVPEEAEEYEECYEEIVNQSADILSAYLATEGLQEYKVPVVEKNGKKFWAVRIDIDNYYAMFPQKPYWVCKLSDELSKLRPKRMPMSDIQVYDLYKKHFGYRKATKLKSMQPGLKAACQRGFSNVFQSFARKTPLSNLTRCDEFGLGLIHYAAIFNRPNLITNLIMLGVDSNSKQQINVKNYMQPIGPLSVHYAARCGALDALSCLLSNYGNVTHYDENGWLPIHHAAYFDSVPAIRLLLRRHDDLKEANTKIDTVTMEKRMSGVQKPKKRDHSRKTPLLCAASSGALEAVKSLLEHGANVSYQDENGRNAIHVASQRCHTNILTYFIEDKIYSRALKPWTILIDLLSSKIDAEKDTSIKCLQLLTGNCKDYWQPILNNQGVERICDLLREYTNKFAAKDKAAKKTVTINENPVEADTLNAQRYLNALSVLCNISERNEVKECLCQLKDIGDIMIRILEHSDSEDMKSRTAILIADIASYDITFKDSLADKGCLVKLLHMIDVYDSEDVLVNSVNALEVMCKEHVNNQDFCCKNGALENLVQLLALNSDFLKITVAAAISSLAHDNYQNQNLALQLGIIKPLVELLDTLVVRNMAVKLKVAMALESLAINNVKTQKAITLLGADIDMIKLCEIKSNMEDWSIVVREQAAITLWTLAGTDKPQRKSIAEKIGIPQIISMLMSKSEKLQFVGCKCMIALVLEDAAYQNQILKENGIDPLIRLLRTDKTSNRVILAIFETIGALCVDIAHVNNKLTQNELMEKGAIDIILSILNNPPPKYNHQFIQIEISNALACLILNRQMEPEVEEMINIRAILSLIQTGDLSLRLKAGLAISVLAFNNNDKQFDIKTCGGISFECYKPFFEDVNVDIMNLCDACFQIIVLARIINDRDQVWLTALGVGRLVQLLLIENNEKVVIQTASYMSSLAHTRTGITDAMITCDAVDILCDRLYSTNNQIRFASAVTLGYLTYNRTASRLLLHNCRNVPVLFNTLMSILKTDSKISPQFVESYETALELGLPKLLVKRKVKFYESKEIEEPEFKGFYDRTKSAKAASKAGNTHANKSTSETSTRARTAPTLLSKQNQSQNQTTKLKKMVK